MGDKKILGSIELNRVYQMDCLEGMRLIPDNSIDSCVTDPPYGLSKEPDIREVLTKWLAGEDYEHRGSGFMGKTWDSFVPGPSVWREVYRVLKPGGHALVFAGTRTQDLMTISLRLAGFEVRDVIEWLYFSGFPKSMDVSKAIDKKLGAERKLIGLKYNKGRAKANVYAGQWNIESEFDKVTAPATELAKKWDGWGTALKPAHEPIIMVRKPLDGTVADNVEKWGTGAINIDGCRVPTNDDIGKRPPSTEREHGFFLNTNEYTPSDKGRFPANIVTTEPDAFWSKYCNVTPPELSKKASKKDRNSTVDGRILDGVNRHPTCKPVELMRWIVRLATPPGGIVLEPFAGSGTTCVAAVREGFDFVAFEKEREYIEIANIRLEAEPEEGPKA